MDNMNVSDFTLSQEIPKLAFTSLFQNQEDSMCTLSFVAIILMSKLKNVHILSEKAEWRQKKMIE